MTESGEAEILKYQFQLKNLNQTATVPIIYHQTTATLRKPGIKLS